MEGLTVVDHPLLARHVAVLRSGDTSREQFRHALGEAAAILAYEATRDLDRQDFRVLTPLEPEAYDESPPDVIGAATTFVVDPMLATGGSAGCIRPGLGDAGDRTFGTE